MEEMKRVVSIKSHETILHVGVFSSSLNKILQTPFHFDFFDEGMFHPVLGHFPVNGPFCLSLDFSVL
jgi:hypothetical protein